MQDTKHGKPISQFPLSNPLGEIFAHNANLWFTSHAELLANVDALTHAWLNRRREGVEAGSQHQQRTEFGADAAPNPYRFHPTRVVISTVSN
jgi:hypothetical protein